MPKETKQFHPGDRIKVIKVRSGFLNHEIGETAVVLNTYYDGYEEPVLRVQWDEGFPEQQRCWADQFEIVTQIKVMDDTREYLEAITGGSSNG